jgi:CDP-diacylglycerol--serine O-phosphatidyltransferase
VLAICCVPRLARFNVAPTIPTSPPGLRGFLPAPGPPARRSPCCRSIRFLGVIDDGHNYALFIAPYVAAVALLMVSRVPTYSGKNLGHWVPRDLVR